MVEVLKENPYKKRTWYDEIYDPEIDEVLSEGTPFLADYINNIENGVYNAFDHIMQLQKDQQRMQLQLQLTDRAPGNNGAFTDALDGTSTNIETGGAVVIAAINANTSIITVDDASTLTPFTEVTLFDDTYEEDVLISAINGNQVTVSGNIAHGYKKGARLVRSAVSVDTTNKTMTTAPFTTYNVTLTSVV